MPLAVKSGRPLSRDGLIGRPRLLTKLLGGRATPLLMLAAPAGYGKTSLLTEWTERDSRPSVWLSLESWRASKMSPR
jgi:LuxR family maltose regulon positive regulatory protein